MDKPLVIKQLRSRFNMSGWVLLIYYGIMNLAVTLVLACDLMIQLLLNYNDPAAMESAIEQAATNNGWGYILAVAVGTVILLFWKKGTLKTLWAKEKPMTAGAFFSLAALFFSAQVLAQILTFVLEWLLNRVGLSLLDMMESTSVSGTSVSMFLYASLLGPISEELLFRGLLLRTLQPYGKKFAILATAFLFGMFHGNMIQTPYAFAVGLVLGYVAVEYSLGWAVLLHVLNNMVLADFMTRLSAILPAGVGDLITLLFIWACAIASVVILIRKRRELCAYFRGRKIHPWCLKAFFTAPGVLVFTGLMVGSILLTLLLQLIP